MGDKVGKHSGALNPRKTSKENAYENMVACVCFIIQGKLSISFNSIYFKLVKTQGELQLMLTY